MAVYGINFISFQLMHCCICLILFNYILLIQYCKSAFFLQLCRVHLFKISQKKIILFVNNCLQFINQRGGQRMEPENESDCCFKKNQSKYHKYLSKSINYPDRKTIKSVLNSVIPAKKLFPQSSISNCRKMATMCMSPDTA